MGTVSALDLAIEFRGTEWQHKQALAPLLTSGFENGSELTAPVHL